MGSVSSEVFADTGSPGRDRSLGLLGSFNIFTIVTTNLCNSNMFRDQHFGDVSWGDPNNQREDWWAMKQLGRNDLFGGSEPADSPVSLVREVFEPGGGPAVGVRGGRDGLQHQPLALLHRDLQPRQRQQEGVLQDFL